MSSTDIALQQALAHHQSGRLADAERIYREVLAREPDNADALHLLGAVAYAVKQFAPAEQLVRRAILLRPASANYHNTLGNILRGAADVAGAAAAYERAVTLDPNHVEAWANVGVIRREQGRLADAVEAYAHALRLNPTFAGARGSLATALKEQGRVDEAIEQYRRALADDPSLVDVHSNFLYALHNSDRITPQEVFQEHRRWGERFAAPLATSPPAHSNDRDPERRLRVGYVSADFRQHAVATFLSPLIDHRDRSQVEFICYSDVVHGDAVTASIRSRVDEFHDVFGLTDEQLASLIRNHRIDILVDLAGHTQGSRLMVFARKPAPVQFTYLGYPATTGVRAIDYRITDSIADRLGMSERFHVESKLARTSRCFLSYPLPADLPPITSPPAMRNGYVTFGSFNTLAKISATTLRLWRDVLGAVSGSRMLIKAAALGDARTRDLAAARFAEAGLLMERVELHGPVATHDQHLRMYDRVDIALDTFPYNGTTTTCEALSMGVPVVSLAGESHASRVGASLLAAAGSTDWPEPAHWATHEPGKSVEIARRLSADLSNLATIRREMRNRLSASALCDGGRSAHDIERLFRDAWRRFCASVQSAPPPPSSSSR